MGNRVALVSGGSRGIGRAICVALANEGCDVAVNYRKDEEAAAQTVALVEELGRKAKAYSASVADYDEVEAMCASVAADFGEINVMVHNAGIASRGQSIAKTEPAEMERVVRTHGFGAWNLAHATLPHMRDKGRGDIVMISSVATQFNSGYGAPYNMGKAMLESCALTLSKEENRNNIFVNIVAPGLTVTDMGERLAKATMAADNIHDLDKSMPYGHVCEPEEVAEVVRFFVSDKNTYANGQKVNVDGGGMR